MVAKSLVTKAASFFQAITCIYTNGGGWVIFSYHTWKNTNYSHFQSKTDTKIYQMQEAYLQELGLTFLIPII